MTGVLQPVSLSISTRGTHVLLQHGKKVYLVESTTIDLRDFEGVDIVIDGEVSRNTDPEALPILAASGVRLVDMPVKEWESEVLGITLEAPAQWHASLFDDGMRFTETGSSLVLMNIYPSTFTQLPVGTTLHIAGRRAVKTTGMGGQVVFVQNGRDILAFAFTPPSSVSGKAAERDFTRVLRSVTFIGVMQSSTATQPVPTGTGSKTGSSSASLGQPCGGPAGVLCPAGSSCVITDPTDEVGRCVKGVR